MLLSLSIVANIALVVALCLSQGIKIKSSKQKSDDLYNKMRDAENYLKILYDSLAKTNGSVWVADHKLNSSWGFGGYGWKKTKPGLGYYKTIKIRYWDGSVHNGNEFIHWKKVNRSEWVKFFKSDANELIKVLEKAQAQEEENIRKANKFFEEKLFNIERIKELEQTNGKTVS